MPKLYGIQNCVICGKEVEIYQPKRLGKDITCSRTCMGIHMRKERNCTCPVCAATFRLKPSALAKSKHPPCCSTACLGELRKTLYAGDNNPNYLNRGESNPLHRGYRREHAGYYYVYVPEHPFCEPTMSGRIREHRLVAEQHHLTEENSVTIDGVRYLSPEFDVHHKDENKLNNDPANLEILSRAAHTTLHNNTHEIIRCPATGRILGLL